MPESRKISRAAAPQKALETNVVDDTGVSFCRLLGLTLKYHKGLSLMLEALYHKAPIKSNW